MVQKSKARIRLGIILIAWPAALLALSLFLFALANWVFGVGTGGEVSPVATVVNIILFVVGALATGLGLPSVIIGIILLASGPKPTETIVAQHDKPVEANGIATASLVLGITSIVFSVFVGFVAGILAIIFGAIGLKKEARKGQALAGLITGIVGTLLSILIGFLIIVTAYAGIQSRVDDTLIQSYATTVQKETERFRADNDVYPSYSQISEKLSAVELPADVTFGEEGSLSDVVYIPCSGEGALIWYWDASDETYSTIEAGLTTHCEFKD